MTLQFIKIFFLFLIFNGAHSQETITFPMLSDPNFDREFFEGKEVSVTGFYCESSEGRGCLTSNPQFKSCCVASFDKLSQQILLEEPLVVSKSQVVTLEGLFSTSLLKSKDGTSSSNIYFLKSPIVKETHFKVSFLYIFLISLFIFLIIKKVNKIKNKT